MKQVTQPEFAEFVNVHHMKIVAHASPMPSHGYGDDRSYYEGNGRKAEYRVQWEPVKTETFLISEAMSLERIE